METLDVMLPELVRQEYEERIQNAAKARRLSGAARVKRSSIVLRGLLSLLARV